MTNYAMKYDWTDKKRKALPALWQKHSAMEIAVQFGWGKEGKNAVIGVVHRMNLTKDGSKRDPVVPMPNGNQPRLDGDLIRRLIAEGKPNREIAAAAGCDSSTVSKYKKPRTDRKVIAPRVVVPVPQPPIVRPTMAAIEAVQQIKMSLPLSSGTRCLFPLWGHKERPTHRYCEKPALTDERLARPRVYCAEHRRACFAPFGRREAA